MEQQDALQTPIGDVPLYIALEEIERYNKYISNKNKFN